MNVQRTIVADGAPTPIRFSVSDYIALDRTGVLDRYAKTELIEGVIVVVNAQHVGHARVQKLLYDQLNEACRVSTSTLDAYFELSVMVSDENMPQPDIVLTGDLPEKGPLPLAAARLIVEVAGSSLSFDTREKAALYAAAGVPEYWVADVSAGLIHQMWSPADGIYAERRDVAFGEPVAAATIPDLTVTTDRLA